ncbi:MAG: nuclear transport factor 2 family protein [Leucobacter sp.]|nr:nuclear transport factor 2 family protein [Leucobacter sp.]
MTAHDRQDIVDVLFEYARNLDQKNWEGFAELYAPDGVLVLPWGDEVPRSEIASDTEHKLGRFVATQHISANQEVAFDGDTARSRSNVQAAHVTTTGEVWIIGGFYECDYRLIDSAWKFTRVKLNSVWESGPLPEFE